MIAVVGSPVGRRSSAGLRAAGLPVAIARAVVAAGGAAQLVGKLGEGTDADAIALSLAADRIGHVALLRTPGPAAILAGEASSAAEADGGLDRLAGLDGSDEPAGAARSDGPPTSSMDAGDLELALRYLPDYGVVVLAEPLDPVARSAAVEAARWSGATVIVVAAAGDESASMAPEFATVLEAPSEDEEGAFASLVGRYAAALDAGTPAAEAFASASAAVGWAAVSD